MPIRIPKNLPALAVLGGENIFVMDDQRAIQQDIRPIELAIVNLMPNKIETEIQILRMLSNTPLQVNVDLVRIDKNTPKNTPSAHMDTFYQLFDDVCGKKYDGMIITGAPVAMLPFEEIKYWNRMKAVMTWAKKNVQSTMYLCWAAHAAMFHYYGVQRTLRPTKLSGVFQHEVYAPNDELMRGFDSPFFAPHSRYGQIPSTTYQQAGLNLLAGSEETGAYIAASDDKRTVMVLGHPEYEADTLAVEYARDLATGQRAVIPHNYFIDDDPQHGSKVTWRAHGTLLYTNWLNYYVYQITPFDLTTLG